MGTHQPLSLLDGLPHPAAAPQASVQVLLCFGPGLPNCHQAALSWPSGPLRGGAGNWTLLFPRVNAGNPLLTLLICRISVLFVTFGSLPFLLLLEASPSPHLICFQLPCLGSTTRCSSLFCAPPPQ